MADFQITTNDGEAVITTVSERAAQARGIAQGHSVAFKGYRDAREYVQVVEAEGFTFEGKELIGA
jgi:hypothetical protein